MSFRYFYAFITRVMWKPTLFLFVSLDLRRRQYNDFVLHFVWEMYHCIERCWLNIIPIFD